MTAFVLVGSKWQIDKDPDAVLDYIEDWSAWLTGVGDSLQSHTCVVTGSVAGSNVTKNSSIINGATVVAWISGGIAGETVTVVMHVVTTGGRQDDRTFYLKIRDR